jgi:hypothetical protein
MVALRDFGPQRLNLLIAWESEPLEYPTKIPPKAHRSLSLVLQRFRFCLSAIGHRSNDSTPPVSKKSPNFCCQAALEELVGFAAALKRRISVSVHAMGPTPSKSPGNDVPPSPKKDTPLRYPHENEPPRYLLLQEIIAAEESVAYLQVLESLGIEIWWALQDSNLRLPPCEGGTLPLS